jgi:hypothetical protein
MSDRFREIAGTAILGIDTLWGGDVMNPSGTGRFIADSWFSDEPLPAAYTHPAAARVRETGGVSAKTPDRSAIDAYLQAIDIPAAIRGLEGEAAKMRAAASKTPPLLRAEYVYGLAICFETMWDLAMEVLGNGPAVPYDRCVVASTGRAPEPSDPEPKRERVARLLAGAGFPSGNREQLLASVDAWRKSHAVPMASIKMMGATAIAYFDQLSAAHLTPFLPAELSSVPRANIEFQPIRDAWFSGSMNYLGRARNADGSPRYEANYEINASLEISYPEFLQLVSHEVVPGHVTTFAYLQNLYWRGLAGFEATVLTMNTRAAALFEGIANNAILIAHGVLDAADLPDRDMEIGALLALLICKTDLSVIALIGIILLIGIVKKNAIMMIDFAIDAERNEGKPPADAIYEACLVRFRPIMMTTMAALTGTLPIALGFGAGGEARRPLGLAVVGGLVVSQLLTLYITPVFYVYMERLRGLWFRTRPHKAAVKEPASAR